METQNLTSKEAKKQEKLREVYQTVHGKMSIMEMIRRFGSPCATIKLSKIEVRTTFTSNPFIKTERVIDCELFFKEDLVVKGLKKEFVLSIDYSGIKKEYVRHPNYNPSKPPKATKKEIKEWEIKNGKAIS